VEDRYGLTRSQTDDVIRTRRLELRAASKTVLDAMIAGDVPRLNDLLETDLASPFVPPPEIGDVLDYFRGEVRKHPAHATWLLRLVIRASDRAVVGSVGGSGPPGDDGIFLIGYSVYPEHEGHGYASEAAGGLIDWALRQRGVQRIRATIPPSNAASRRIAEKCGMVVTGTSIDDEAGDVLIYERASGPTPRSPGPPPGGSDPTPP
jgi:RimJ/RimL family protein N-acetyltransferase